MDALKAAGLCALLVTSPHMTRPCGVVVEIHSQTIDRWHQLIEAASMRFSVPASWIRAVMARESAGHTALHGAAIVSSAGAMGLMQLMPGTWAQMRARYRLGTDPFDPHDNIFAGTAYLREMFDRFGYPDLFAAYQAGPGRVEAYLSGRKSLPETTKTYLESIVAGVKIASFVNEMPARTITKSASDLLFFVRAENEKAAAENNNSTPGISKPKHLTSDLFVPLFSTSSQHRP